MNDEIRDLEKQVYELGQKLAAARRNATPEPVHDYEFQTTTGTETLANLFCDRNELLTVHNMGKGCPYCTLWADGLNGFVKPLNDRAALVVVSPDAPVVQKDFAESRQWKFKMVSYGDNTFAKDMGYHGPMGYGPGISAFRKSDDGTIVRTGTANFGPGDQFCAVWPIFELLGDKEGDWSPKYNYD